MTAGVEVTELIGRTGTRQGRAGGAGRATFEVHALYGPPRPVLVLVVGGEVDRANDAEMIAAVRRTAELAATPPGRLPRGEFGCRSLADTVVVDLRAVSFIGARALDRLAAARDGAGEHVRIVASRDGVVRRALSVVDTPSPCPLYAEIADAVLGEVDPTRHAVD